MNPMLLNVLIPIYTGNLVIRPPQAGDGPAVNQAVIESFETLTQWMPWAGSKPSVEDSEIFVRTAQAKWILREELTLFIFDHSGNFIGATGFHHINWDVRSFEMGYWVRSSYAGRGIITQSTNALTRYAFEHLKAVRVELKCDADNLPSRKIAEKLGFALEGILLNNALKTDNKTVQSTAIYARYNTHGLPELQVTW